MRVLGGTLLVAGTAIGAGMLALPFTTAMAGLGPSIILFVVVWLFMTYTAFLMLETNMAVQGTPNIISMARQTLGPVGEAIAWFAYLLLLYSLTASYLSGCGTLLVEAIDDLFGVGMPGWIGPIPFVLIFGGVVYIGMKPADYLNRLLMIGLGVCFLLLIIFISPHVHGEYLTRAYFPYMVVPVSVAVTAFGFHIILPSLCEYLYRDLKKIKKCLIYGSLCPITLYIVWQILIIGVIPIDGDEGLLTLLASGTPEAGMIQSLNHLVGGWMAVIVGVFGFFAILTSFLGVSLSLSDFLADGLRLHHLNRGRLIAVVLAFVPPLIYALLIPGGFIFALQYAGIFVAILLGIMPALMAFSVRYSNKFNPEYRVWGGPVMLVVVIVAFVAVIVFHLTQETLGDLLREGVVA